MLFTSVASVRKICSKCIYVLNRRRCALLPSYNVFDSVSNLTYVTNYIRFKICDNSLRFVNMKLRSGKILGSAVKNNSKPLKKGHVFEQILADKKIDMLPIQTLTDFFNRITSILNSPVYLIDKGNAVEIKPAVFAQTYNILWPKSLAFQSYGYNKKDASRNAAKNVLYWLKNNLYMNEFHRPILQNVSPQIRSYSTSASTQEHINNEIATSTLKKNISNKTENVNCDSAQSETVLFPHPKGVLHNCFTLLSKELKQRDLQLNPLYKTIKQANNTKYSLWECTYHLKWPEQMKFSAISSRKQDASHKAACDALLWLYQNKKITDKGQPIIYEKNDIAKLTKKSYEILNINDNLYRRLSKLSNDFKSGELQDFLENYKQDNADEDSQHDVEREWPEFNTVPFRQKFRGLDFYLAQEPVRLPISKYKDELIELLRNNSVVIVKGEPACGKSTRIPQYVLEAWARDESHDPQTKPCRIIVTQPRRIAAVSLAERVANEREESVGETVGYHIRFKSNFNKHTGHIMYCTTGILLRHIQSNPKLSDCSHIILDEAHERDVNIDLLMNLIRHTLNLNPNLKLIVMSATIDANMFREYYNNAPILNIPGFTYPVQEHFLTDKTLKTYEMCQSQYPQVIAEDVVNCIKFIHKNKGEGAILCFLPGWEDIKKVMSLIPERNDLTVLCLHSRLDMSEQRKIFSRTPPGVRKIILSTNIAETSVTIDDVVYVVDTGIHKEERLDVQKGVMCIDNHWISKASAKQRKGRAGRTQEGECFHLYPKSKYDELLDYSIPEILRTSLTKIVLDSKVYSNNMNAIEFLQQLICPPVKSAIEAAVQELKELELLNDEENLTPLGRTLSNFQLAPKLSKAMVNAVIFKCATPVVDIVTLFSAESALFSKSLVDKETKKKNLAKYSKSSDHLAMMEVFEKWLYYVESLDDYSAADFCRSLGLIQPKMYMLQKLRNIHFDYLHKGLYDVLPISDVFSDNYELIKAVLLSGVGTVLQQRDWDIVKGRLRKSNILLTRHNQKATITSDSVNSRKGTFPSKFLLYINETISNLRRTTLVRETSDISPLSVLLFTNKSLEIEEVATENYSNHLESDDQVLLKLGGTKIEFLCDRRHALSICDCKEAIQNFRKYYIYQLTTGNDYNSTVNKHWQEVLTSLNEILLESKKLSTFQ